MRNPLVAAMQQIADWLEKLGMSEYAQRFAENRIDFSVLRDLTDQDLKDLGVVLGDRRKILPAIADLNDVSETATPRPRPASTPSVAAMPHPPVAEASGERRHVTVMFCDLVDSTGIAAKLDAEEWRDLVGAYLDAASAAVAEMGDRLEACGYLAVRNDTTKDGLWKVSDRRQAIYAKASLPLRDRIVAARELANW
jgi:class 3 adenylate cyclase